MLDDQSIDSGFIDWPRHRPARSALVFTARLDAAGERYLKRKIFAGDFAEKSGRGVDHRWAAPFAGQKPAAAGGFY
jgi:hypothetical protein